MATGSLWKKFQQEVACSICLEPFSGPVLLDCGHNFCQACIARWWEEFATYTVCPQCPDTIQPRSFRPNTQLAKVVELIKGLPRDGDENKVCVHHQKPLVHFCMAEEVLTCVCCAESEEHRGHRVVLLEEAVAEYKIHVLRVLDILRNGRKEILTDKLEVEKKTQQFCKKVEAEKKIMLTDFQSLHHFLQAQEQLMLARIQEVEEKIIDKRNEHIARAFQEVASLDSKVRMLEKMGRLPMNELLKDAGRILERCREQLKRPDPFPPESEWRILDLRDLSTHLAGAIQQFKDSLALVNQEEEQLEEDVPLDLTVAHPTDPI